MDKIKPLGWLGLTLASLLLLAGTFITGAAASGLDIGEKCAAAGQTLDRVYRKQHQQESQQLLPMHSMCNAGYDLVPPWVNPGLAIFALLTLACLIALIFSLAGRGAGNHRRKTLP